tara:strand:+ start:205 stop:348 length:144 start_codon:yes stop_codon:yes gene_type:complete
MTGHKHLPPTSEQIQRLDKEIALLRALGFSLLEYMQKLHELLLEEEE